MSVDRRLTGDYTHTSTGRFREIRLFFSFTLVLQLLSKTARATQTNRRLLFRGARFRSIRSVTFPQQTGLKAHQFLQAFFFLPAPSAQAGAVRELGSGFLKSSSSRRASESTRSCRKMGNKEPHSTQRNSAVTLATSPQLTKSSSFMSLADSIHIVTVLGSRAGFSADMTDVTRCKRRPNQEMQPLLYNVFHL